MKFLYFQQPQLTTVLQQQSSGLAGPLSSPQTPLQPPQNPLIAMTTLSAAPISGNNVSNTSQLLLQKDNLSVPSTEIKSPPLPIITMINTTSAQTPRSEPTVQPKVEINSVEIVQSATAIVTGTPASITSTTTVSSAIDSKANDDKTKIQSDLLKKGN